MSRRRNINEPGHAHELTFSCYQGFQFLTRERVCQWLAESLDAARAEYSFDLWCYVFMPEHVHLVVCPRQKVYDIAQIRRSIKEPVARHAIAWLEEYSPEWIDKITVKKGERVRRCFWQPGGGYDRNIIEPETLMKMIDYIHRNPVRRGLVERGRVWRWSSAAWFDDLTRGPIALDRIPPEWVPNE